jgi:hypothetical protein
MDNMPVVASSDGHAIDTENLATPDNSHNCEAPNAADVEQIKPPESPKLPLAFTVITSSNPARLTKIIGLDANGAMRKETSAMLSRGQAQRVVVADLNGLKGQLDNLTSAQAVTWGVTKDDTMAICTQGDDPGAASRCHRPHPGKLQVQTRTWCDDAGPRRFAGRRTVTTPVS